MPHFQLVTTDGDALGPVELGRTDSQPGSIISSGSRESNLRVLVRLDVGDPDPEKFAILVVEETS